MKPHRAATCKAIGRLVSTRMTALDLSVQDVADKARVSHQMVSYVVGGGHLTSEPFLKRIFHAVGLDLQPPTERTILWVPGSVLGPEDPDNPRFRWAYYNSQRRLEAGATLIRYCTTVLSTTLSPPELLSKAVEIKFGRSRAARTLASEVTARSRLVCDRIRRGELRVQALFLQDETREQLRDPTLAARIGFIADLHRSGSLELRVVTRRITDEDRYGFSFAMIHGRELSHVAASDQPIRGQTGRDCCIESPGAPGAEPGQRASIYDRSLELFSATWNGPHTHRIHPAELIDL